MPSAEEIERMRELLVDWTPEVRQQGLAEAMSLDEQGRMAVVVACDITGQTPLSDEIVELTAASWREWPTLTSLCLRQCSFLTAMGCAIIGRQGRIKDLELAGAGLLDDLAFQELAKLPLERFEVWEADLVTVTGATSLAQLSSLRELEWQNAPKDPAVTTALAKSKSIEILHYTTSDSTPELISPLCTMNLLKELHVFGVDDNALTLISKLNNLERLRVEFGPRVTDVGISAISEMSRLTSIQLFQTNITEMGIASLCRLSGLEELFVYSRETDLTITDEVAASIGALPNLRKMHFSGHSDLSDAGVSALIAGGKLEELNLGGSKRISDRSMPALENMTMLQVLDLSGTSISDAGMPYLSKLLTLSELSLARTSITSAGLHNLKPLTGLQKLDLDGCCGIAPMVIEPLLGMSKLHYLNLQETGPLDIEQCRLLSQNCRHLAEIRGSFSGSGAISPLAFVDRLRKLWISSAGGLLDKDLVAFERCREMHSLTIVDAPWLTDDGLEIIKRIPSLNPWQ